MNGLRFIAGAAAALVAASCATADVMRVTGLLSDTVQSYDPLTGAFLGVFASGSGLDGPQGMTLGADGNLYVGAEYSHSVHKFNATTGAFVGMLSGFAGPADVLFAPGGSLMVMNHIDTGVSTYDPVTGAPMGTAAVFPTGSTHAHSMALGPDGLLYAGNLYADSVMRFDPATGAFMGTFVASGAGGLTGPHDMVWDAAGNLLVASHFTASVKKYDGVSGAYIGEFITLPPGTEPWAMKWGPGGFLYLSAGTSVGRFTAAGAFDGFAATAAGDTLVDFVFVVPGPAGGMVILLGLGQLGRRARRERANR